VTGNLYVPEKPGKSVPGLLIAHAHHRDKPQAEMQDMGMLWARAGCLVLVIDQVGYGERRSHPFNTDDDYPKPYRASRQDYYFRYDTGIELQVAGDCLMGWMVWDLMRGVDLLLQRGADPEKIALLGAVAGGGDPAGITAALDKRITCCVPFNFGGPQPETAYPLPEDTEKTFNYLGFTYWDSTRGLRLGGRDGFGHWLITSSIAPRKLLHSHEFSWDKRDPVYKRYEKIYGDFYKVPDNLGVAHGKGILKLRPPEASHCTNIGSFHRKMIHPAFERWFGIKAEEYSANRSRAELTCMTPEARAELKPKSFNTLVSELGAERIAAARKKLAGKSPAEQRDLLRKQWSELLGPNQPAKAPVVKSTKTDEQKVAGAKVERVVLEVEPDFLLPVLVLVPEGVMGKAPVVVGLAQAGKAGFLKNRADEVQALLKAGTIVCLPDVRGTGEIRSGSSRGRGSADNDHSVHEQLFGETMLGQRLRDLHSVLAYLRARPDVDGKNVALWGDSFARTNDSSTNFKVPHAVSEEPNRPEPLGGLLALFGALYDDGIRAVYVSRGLSDYHSILGHFMLIVPDDACVPGALTTGDIADIAAALAPRPLRLEALVDGKNLPVGADKLKALYAPAVASYQGGPLQVSDKRTSAAWLADQLKK
ncbi:MAG: hypothetical protein AB7K24_09890, partial [Gemmataceae bacterium]